MSHCISFFCFLFQTMEEIRRLEQALVTGHLPSEFAMDTEMADGAAVAAVAVENEANGADGDGAAAPAAAAENGAEAAVQNGGQEGDKPEEMAVG